MVPTARAVFAALLLSMVGACKPWAPPAPVHVKLLQANVGNALLSCDAQLERDIEAAPD